ncbi:ParB/RepB/Spo0J family partition protein [Pseudoruminococcus massiliensis]|uniref:ParB/RepB/Spo0J family partition protein n=1 Tax=Pseudoruminococcus massiliensis TaxID=2086583 RepID=UPI000D0E3E11|nr:ParB/RepB/Spo0J family partition protein [Pseudoruminococcus massiliensis]
MKNETKMSAEKVVKQPKPKLMNIKLEKLHPFKSHPYKVLDDESMTELVESIKEYGFLNRIIVRPLEEKQDEYEIISGHRRVHAAELLEIKEVSAVVHFIDRDQATILMVDSNCQCENLSLMEKARSYRMKADALSHQGRTCGQTGHKSRDNVSDADSGRTVQRLIRLTYLMPELQEYVDNGKMKMLPAYELSFLNEEAQRDVIDRIDETENFPSHAQARRMRAAFEEGKLDYDTVAEIMAEVKPNQIEKLKIPMDDIRKYVPSSMTPAEMLEYLLKLVKKEYDRQHNRNAR